MADVIAEAMDSLTIADGAGEDATQPLWQVHSEFAEAGREQRGQTWNRRASVPPVELQGEVLSVVETSCECHCNPVDLAEGRFGHVLRADTRKHAAPVDEGLATFAAMWDDGHHWADDVVRRGRSCGQEDRDRAHAVGSCQIRQ
jgi:hypothetical protein